MDGVGSLVLVMSVDVNVAAVAGPCIEPRDGFLD